MNDDTLARCHMVLALSEDTINYQFQQLWKQKIIRNDWKVLVRQTNNQSGDPVYTVKTGEAPDFDTALSTWVSTQRRLATLFVNGQYEKYGELLAEATSKGLLYNYGWSASIDAPAITVLKDSTSSLLFKVSFSSGALYNSGNPTLPVDTFDLAGCVYAFGVPVGRIDINSTEELLTSSSRTRADKVIRDGGLKDGDFTIQGLLLNFENANISNFDEEHSKFPAKMAGALQTTIEDYFKLVVAKDKNKNPYVLGYAVKVPTQSAGKATFQPTEAHFSTTYSATKGRSAFNFLLMTGGNPFPAGQNTGVLPRSLLESGGYDPKSDGIFAIDYAVFADLLLEPLVAAIKQTINKSFAFTPLESFKSTPFKRDGQRWTLTVEAESLASFPEASWWDTNPYLRTSTTVNSTILLKNGTAGELIFQCTFDYSVTIQISGSHRVTAYQFWLSTSGNNEHGLSKEKGRSGYVEMSIRPGAEGGLDFQIGEPVSPVLGNERAPEEPSAWSLSPIGTLVGLAAPINYIVLASVALDALKASQKIGEAVGGVLEAIRKVIDSLSTGKIILPLGQIYTFKDIRLHDSANTDNNAVLLNINYARVIH